MEAKNIKYDLLQYSDVVLILFFFVLFRLFCALHVNLAPWGR